MEYKYYSQIEGYRVPFKKENRFKFDDMVKLLESCNVFGPLNNCQYIKTALKINIVLSLEPFNNSNEVPIERSNYLKILNIREPADEVPANPLYYFVDKVEYLNNSSIRLFLTLDTLNSFNYDYFSSNTHILREHRDRLNVNSYNVIGDFIEFPRKIYPMGEGHSFEKFRLQFEEGESRTFLYDNDDRRDLDFYLVYKNKSDKSTEVNPIQCNLVPSKSIPLVKGSVVIPSRVISVEALEGNKYYYINAIDNPNYQFKCDSAQITAQASVIYLLERGTTDTNKIKVEKLIFGSSNEFLSVEEVGEFNFITNQQMNFYRVLTKRTNNWDFITKAEGKYPIYCGNQKDLMWESIDEIDRTDTRLIKIFLLPYPLFKLEYTTNPGTNFIILPNDWQEDFSSRSVVLKNPGAKFIRQLDLIKDDGKNNFFQNLVFTTYKDKARRDLQKFRIKNESQAFHSDFMQGKIVYDSFAKEFNFEDFRVDDINVIYNLQKSIGVKYQVSNTINSRFLFTFNVLDTKYIKAREDFNSSLVVNRNNEINLFNSAYINYVRNGYNYDVKNKQRQELQADVGLGISIAGMVASLALAPVTHGVSLLGAVGMGGSAVQQILANQQLHDTLEDSMKQKKQQLKNQSTSIIGSDDVDLLQSYCKNKLLLSEYRANAETLNYYARYYHLYGVNTDRYGIPDINSRTRWNFLRAELDQRDFETTTALTSQVLLDEEIKNDIMANYNNGVTFFHYYNNRYDFKQEFENYEVSLNSITI